MLEKKNSFENQREGSKIKIIHLTLLKHEEWITMHIVP